MEATSAPVSIQQIPIDKITPSPFQTRRVFDETALQELAQTIRDHGLLNPINVRPVGEGFELIAGERRLRAAKLLGWTTIEAKVEEVGDAEAAERVLVENIQREDLNPVEQAQGYKRLANPPFNLSQETIGQKAGKDRSLIAKYLAVAEMADRHPESVNRFTLLGLAHLLELTRLPSPEDQLALADQTTELELSVRQLRVLVDKKLGKPTQVASPRKGQPVQVQGDDPFADLWPSLTMRSAASGNPWGVTYGPQAIPGMPDAFPSWHFWIVNKGFTPKEDLRRWLLQVAEALAENGTTAEADQQAEGVLAEQRP